MDVPNDGFRSMSSDTSRDLTHSDLEKLQKQDLMTDFKQRKLELEAQKNWDRFYHRNKDNFFKDRNWSTKDMQDMCQDINLNSDITYLEAGCGVGNMLFPLAAAYPRLRLQGFDFSANAVRLLEERAAEIPVSVATSIVDLSEPSDETSFEEPADLATLIFVLSAIHPDKHAIAVANMRKYVKIGGSVIVRDYGINDHAMIRFGRGAKLAERFYARQDGTRAFYFRIDELVDLFRNAGFECSRKEYLHRKSINHQKELCVPRIFVQAIFIKLK